VRTLALIALLAFVLPTLSACPSVAIRDQKVYKTEIKFLENSSMQSVDQLEGWVKAHCCANNAVAANDRCQKSAKLVQVVRSRVPWHRDMMFYLGGITEKRPPKDPPKVPAVNALCGG